jgi:hypothetical protein
LVPDAVGPPQRFRGSGLEPPSPGGKTPMVFILWMLSVVLLVAGIYFLLQRKWLIAIVVILVGAIIGPIGVSIIK